MSAKTRVYYIATLAFVSLAVLLVHLRQQNIFTSKQQTPQSYHDNILLANLQTASINTTTTTVAIVTNRSTLIEIPNGDTTVKIKCPHFHSPNRPQLASLIGFNHTIKNDVSWLLDYAIVAFGKCGTTTFLDWLVMHDSIQGIPHEIYDLMRSQPDSLVRRMYCDLSPTTLRGYKSPNDITQEHILTMINQYFYKTKLIVGIRHPVRWFESLYNFRVQMLPSGEMLHPNKLISVCYGSTKNVCTAKGNFMRSLIMLRKHESINMTARQQKWYDDAINHYPRMRPSLDHEVVKNPVFLYEISQLGDKNTSRMELFKASVQHYLNLSTPMPDIPRTVPGSDVKKVDQARRDAQKINICSDEYKPLRKELMILSERNSKWIREVFLESPGVYCGNKEHLKSILKTWMVDPCDTET